MTNVKGWNRATFFPDSVINTAKMTCFSVFPSKNNSPIISAHKFHAFLVNDGTATETNRCRGQWFRICRSTKLSYRAPFSNPPDDLCDYFEMIKQYSLYQFIQELYILLCLCIASFNLKNNMFRLNLSPSE